jgi:hypothetical protein
VACKAQYRYIYCYDSNFSRVPPHFHQTGNPAISNIDTDAVGREGVGREAVSLLGLAGLRTSRLGTDSKTHRESRAQEVDGAVC